MDMRRRQIEFGDFQTPDDLALRVCRRLDALGIRPDVVIEPTCGVGAFTLAAAEVFADAKEIAGFDINKAYLDTARHRLASKHENRCIRLEEADFFTNDWRKELQRVNGRPLVIGNFPWVTNAAQGVIGGSNLPEKSNFLGHKGLDAITGKSNFDISEWMLLEVLRWLKSRDGDIAMLVKTAVARKVLAQAKKQDIALQEAFVIGIDAKKEFGVSVDASLLVMRLSTGPARSHDYTVFDSLDSTLGKRIGFRLGLTVGDLELFDAHQHLVGQSPQKWRSGIKHDASAIMELTISEHGLLNGLGERLDLEPDHLYPLLKGSDIGSNKDWRGKYVLVTQRRVGEATEHIRASSPKTWAYLENHAAQLDTRASTIYANNPRFSMFGVGDYAFRLWRIAICGLYKNLRFRLVGPINDKPVMFDDTVYYVSFDTEEEAREVLERLESTSAASLLSSLIFWDEKRPIKTGILNILDWNRVHGDEGQQRVMF